MNVFHQIAGRSKRNTLRARAGMTKAQIGTNLLLQTKLMYVTAELLKHCASPAASRMKLLGSC